MCFLVDLMNDKCVVIYYGEMKEVVV